MQIEGVGIVGFEGPLAEPLDELIFEATQRALIEADVDLDSIGGIFLAASDLFDGRGISTMTLSSAAGSFSKPEVRVCEDGIGALLLARAFLTAMTAERVIVSAWSKLTDADLEAIERASVEPIFRRDVLPSEDVVRGLKLSRSTGRPTRTSREPRRALDGAVSMVASLRDKGERGVLGLGASTGPYLSGDGDTLDQVRAAASRACMDASIDPGDVAAIYSSQLRAEERERICDVLGVPSVPVVDAEDVPLQLGYATGLLSVARAVLSGSGTSLALGTAGLAGQTAFAAVVGGG